MSCAACGIASLPRAPQLKALCIGGPDGRNAAIGKEQEAVRVLVFIDTAERVQSSNRRRVEQVCFRSQYFTRNPLASLGSQNLRTGAGETCMPPFPGGVFEVGLRSAHAFLVGVSSQVSRPWTSLRFGSWVCIIGLGSGQKSALRCLSSTFQAFSPSRDAYVSTTLLLSDFAGCFSAAACESANTGQEKRTMSPPRRGGSMRLLVAVVVLLSVFLWWRAATWALRTDPNAGKPTAAARGYAEKTRKPRNAAPPEWVSCTSEGGTCSCSGAARFGAGSRWSAPRKVCGAAGSEWKCTSAAFGGADPAPGEEKECQCLAKGAPPASTPCL
eukprot:gene320-446_t